MIEVARRGVVIPGDVNGTMSPTEHNQGRNLASSPYTSWTYSYDEAMRKATDRGTGGIILRLEYAGPPNGAPWNREESPDDFDEEEVLLRGIRMGAEVIFG
jgi:hypothetical protein